MGSDTSDVDGRLLERRRVWEHKDTLRLIYADYYRRILELCPPGPLLDVGGGSGHIKQFRPDAVCLDILPFPDIDIVADAHDIPFDDGHFAAVVMLDVLHHLARPVDFLREAARVLQPGGRLVMIEPSISLVSWWFYRYLHQEPVEMNQDPFEMTAPSTHKDPFDANQAIPTLLFGNTAALRRLARVVPTLTVHTVDWLSLVAYPLSGGFKPWCLIPTRAVPHALTVEDHTPLPVRKACAFRMLVALERNV